MLQALKIGDDKVEFIKDVKAKKYGNDAATCVRFVMQFRRHLFDLSSVLLDFYC